jgi:uncharacterized protein
MNSRRPVSVYFAALAGSAIALIEMPARLPYNALPFNLSIRCGMTEQSACGPALRRYGLMFGLLPRNLEFFDCFNKGAQNALRAAELLVEFTEATGDRRLELVGAIKEKEHIGDKLTHETLDRLQKTYLTPIDGEDIHALTKELDDIVDEIDDAAQRMMIYRIGDMLPGFKTQCQILLKAVGAAADTVAGLRNLKKGRINGHSASIERSIIAVHDAENEGDEIYHQYLGELFESGLGPFDVIKWKEIYEIVEGAIDCCEDVANTVHGIVIKNA